MFFSFQLWKERAVIHWAVLAYVMDNSASVYFFISQDGINIAAIAASGYHVWSFIYINTPYMTHVSTQVLAPN